MRHEKTLIGLIAFFFIFWFGIPLIAPQTAGIIYTVTLPVRHLGVFVHEMGHGLFTLLSGGNFHWFQMELMKGGVAITSGGFRVVTILGGLLGPALLGALLLYLSTKAANVRPVLIGLTLLFALGVYYMVKPLFLGNHAHPYLTQWSAFHLLSASIPAAMIWVTLAIMRGSENVQRFFLQIMGILMCYSGYSDTSYIFHYEPLSNGLYSDARVLASTFWTSVETVPFPLFVVTASVISVLNLGLMAWGTYAALKRSPRRSFEGT